MPILSTQFQYSWKQVFQSKLKYFYLITVIYLVVFQKINIHLLLYFQSRPEVIQIMDPILQIITPRPINVELNLFCYGTIIFLIIYFLNKPHKMLTILHALLLMWMLRWLTIYLLPLATPPHKVSLNDMIAYSHYTISRDLFFSGHTAALVIMLCAINNRWIFLISFSMTLVVVTLLLIGHQHYFLDIISAPFFAYTCYRFADWVDSLLALKLLKNTQAFAVSDPAVADKIGIS